MRINCAGNTDVGVVRAGNEDSFLLDCAQGLFIVADGMGGHAAGEVASEMAVKIVSRELGSLRGLPDGEAAARMRRERKSTRLNSSHVALSRMPSSALKKK